MKEKYFRLLNLENFLVGFFEHRNFLQLSRKATLHKNCQYFIFKAVKTEVGNTFSKIILKNQLLCMYAKVRREAPHSTRSTSTLPLNPAKTLTKTSGTGTAGIRCQEILAQVQRKVK